MRATSPRLLLVDPDSTCAHAIGSALERRGIRVCVAPDLERGLAGEPVFEVVAAEMETLSGPGAARLAERRALPGGPALIVLLRRTEPAAIRGAVRLGAADVLCLPLSVDELAAAVEDAACARPHPPAGASPPGSMRRTYPARPESVERAARDLAAFALRAGAGPACRARLASACAEIVHNSCHHAHAHRDGRVEVDAHLEGQDVVVTIRDNGEGFDASTALNAALEQGFAVGLGRAAALAEGLDVSSEPGTGSRVVLRFGALRADFDDARQLDLSELDFLLPDPARELLRAIASGSGAALVLSPALAVLVGRLLAGPDPRRVLSMALWS